MLLFHVVQPPSPPAMAAMKGWTEIPGGKQSNIVKSKGYWKRQVVYESWNVANNLE